MITEPVRNQQQRRTNPKPTEMKVSPPGRAVEPWAMKHSESDDMKTQFKYRKLRQIDEARKFEAEEQRIRAELRKRNKLQKHHVVTNAVISAKPVEEIAQTARASTNEFLQLSRQVLMSPLTNNEAEISEVIEPKLDPIMEVPLEKQIPEEIIIEPQGDTPKPTNKANPLKPMLQRVFQPTRPKFQINNKDYSKDDEARRRIHRRESYYNRIRKDDEHNPEKPLNFEKLLEWKVEQDKKAHPAKYRRLGQINMSAKDICLAKDVELKEKETLVHLGNEYMLQARKLAKKVKTEPSVQQPTITPKYIDYIPLVKQPKVNRTESLSPQDLRKRAKQLEFEALSRIEEYVDRRKNGLKYTERAPYERDIDSKLIDYVKAKVACLDIEPAEFGHKRAPIAQKIQKHF